MDGLSYSRSISQYAEQSYQSELERFNQQKQINTAHFEADKKDIIEPVSFVSGGLLTAGVGGLGKKLVAKTGIKAFGNIGKESLSTTLRNVTSEAIANGRNATGVLKTQINTTIGKALQQGEGAQKLINDTLTKNGFDPLSAEDFKNPNSLGDKLLQQTKNKTQGAVNDVANDVATKARSAGDDVLNEGKSQFRSASQILSDAKGKAVSSLTNDAGSAVSSASNNLPKTFMSHLEGQDLPSSLTGVTDDTLLSSLRDQSSRVSGKFDATPASEEFGDETGSASLQAPKPLGQSGGNFTPQNQTKDPTTLSEDTPNRVVDTDAPDVPDVAPVVDDTLSDGSNILSKLTEVVGATDVATGGADIAGDVLEGVLGIAGLFLPGMLDKQSASASVPKNDFVTSFSAGTGVE